MLKNVGGVDRWVRIVLGLGLIAGAFVAPGPWHWIVAPGAILVVTGVVRFCPAYWLLRIRTLSRQPETSQPGTSQPGTSQPGTGRAGMPG